MQKEMHERRLKVVLSKLESYLKSEKGGGLTQEQINMIGQLSEDEVLEQYEMEKEMEDEIQYQLDQLLQSESPINKMSKHQLKR